MPVILPKDCYGLWLDSIREGFSFPEYMRPYDPYKMTVYCRGTQGMEPGTKGVFGLKGWRKVGENCEIVTKN